MTRHRYTRVWILLVLTLIVASLSTSSAASRSSEIKKLTQRITEQEAEIELLKLRLEKIEVSGVKGKASEPGPADITFP
jgi:cell division protein FtsB